MDLRDADAVVFAAGAGPGSGAARKETVDRDAAILLADAAEAAVWEAGGSVTLEPVDAGPGGRLAARADPRVRDSGCGSRADGWAPG